MNICTSDGLQAVGHFLELMCGPWEPDEVSDILDVVVLMMKGHSEREIAVHLTNTTGRLHTRDHVRGIKRRTIAYLRAAALETEEAA